MYFRFEHAKPFTLVIRYKTRQRVSNHFVITNALVFYALSILFVHITEIYQITLIGGIYAPASDAVM